MRSIWTARSKETGQMADCKKRMGIEEHFSVSDYHAELNGIWRNELIRIMQTGLAKPGCEAGVRAIKMLTEALISVNIL